MLEPGRPVETYYPAFLMLRAMESVHHCLDSISSTVYSGHKEEMMVPDDSCRSFISTEKRMRWQTIKEMLAKTKRKL